MQLNDIGEMVESIWSEIPEYYKGVSLDSFVIMPNHIHGIIILNVGATPRGCPRIEYRQAQGPTKGQAQGPAPTLSLPDVVHRFKSLTTNRYKHNVIQKKWPPFQGTLWQRNYYERILRSNEINNIREYIKNNPGCWSTDEENPEYIKSTVF